MGKLFQDEANRQTISHLFILLYKFGIYTPLNPLLDHFNKANPPHQLPTYLDGRKRR